MKFSDFWKKIAGTPATRITRITINPDNIEGEAELNGNFERREQYFMVKVNEMYLTKKREWFNGYEPIVFVVSEFIYDGEKREVPFVVGPSLLGNKMELPDGFIFQDTTVAGLHPFAGGPFTISVVLAKFKSEKYLRKLLEVIESTAHTYTAGFATMVSQYIKVATVVLDGIDNLTGSNDIDPIMGNRREYNSEIGNFKPGYFAMINIDEDKIGDENKFFVKDNRLHYGDSMATAKPYKENEYILYSILSLPKRSDVEALNFYKDWSKLANNILDKNSISASELAVLKGKLFALQDGMYLSPDLIPKQADALSDEFEKEFDRMVNKRLIQSGPKTMESKKQKDPWEKKMEERAMKLFKTDNQ